MQDLDSELTLGGVIGGLAATGARLWGRASGPGRLHAWVGSQPDLRDAKLLGISLPLTSESGYAGVVPLGGLQPDTRYYYSLTLTDTPPAPLPDPFSTFQTAPDPGSRVPFNLAFGSCFLPENRMAGKIFETIEGRRELDALRFMMLLGDQIYAEAADRNGLGKVAVSLDEYRAIYTYNWSRPPLQKLLANLPAYMIMDDHEVDNDWSWADLDRSQPRIPWFDRIFRRLAGRPLDERSLSRKRVGNALQAYWEHQALHAPFPDERRVELLADFERPDPEQPAGKEGDSDSGGVDQVGASLKQNSWGPYYYDFVFGAAAFFVFDLRTQRVKAGRTRELLGEAQWEAFEAWIRAVKDEYPFKFIVTSSSVLFDMWVDITRDRWNGFPEERNRLLQLLSELGVEGIYFLTGDLHSSHAIRATLRSADGDPIPIWEFCASPFEQSHSLLAKYTYQPVKSEWLLDQELNFRAAEHSFGVIEIDYPDGGSPGVVFKVYGEDGGMMAEVS